MGRVADAWPPAPRSHPVAPPMADPPVNQSAKQPINPSASPPVHTSLRVIALPPADVAWTMAVDEALWQAHGPGDPPTLTLHRFARESVTLGFAQTPADLARAGLDHLPWTRRITGGGAIHHHAAAVSFGLIGLPLGGPKRPGEAIRAVGGLLVDLWALLGRRARLLREGVPPTQAAPLCADRRCAGDVVLGERKVAGIAQRARGGRLLVQCALMAPTACAGAEAGLLPLLTGLLRERFGAECVQSELAPAERRAAEALRAERYLSPRWMWHTRPRVRR